MKKRPLRDYNGDILNPGDLVWLTDHRPMELAIVLGESQGRMSLVRPVNLV